MNIRVHADDLALSQGITDSILACHDEGALTSTSVLANGTAFEYALSEWRKRPGLDLAVHLNIVEGPSVHSADELDELVDKDGLFRHSFLSLLLEFFYRSPRSRQRLQEQVQQELRAQMLKVRMAIGDDVPLGLDSHQHVHTIPEVFRIVLSLCAEFGITYIRIPREPYIWSGPPLSPCFCGWRNHVKHIILKALSRRCLSMLRREAISHNDFLLGILSAGQMTSETVKRGLAEIARRSSDSHVEVLFHPCVALCGEDDVWQQWPRFKGYYHSPWRNVEAETLKSEVLAATLGEFRGE